MKKLPTIEQLFESGVHYGHVARRWNPKMESYIFTQKAGIHLIDLEKTEKQLQTAMDFIRVVAGRGGKVIFLATKKQSAEIVKTEASRAGAMYLTHRWLGGLLTNFESVRKTIQKFDDLEEKLNKGDGQFKKKEQRLMQSELVKLEKILGGIRSMNKLPDAIFIVDSRKEDNAVREATKMNIPTVALVDTNADPTRVTYPIVANDDSIKSVSILVKAVANSYEEGVEIFNKKAAKEAEKAAKEKEKEEVKV